MASTTNQLHKIPFKKSTVQEVFIFFSATVKIQLVSGNTLACQASIAKKRAPKKFPKYDQNQTLIKSKKLVFPLNSPIGIIKVFPVYNSAPAIMTKERAIPKVAPIIR